MALDRHISTDRYLDVADEPTKRLGPIEGYELKELVPLEEAVRPLQPIITNIQSYVWTATGNSENSTDGLDLEESAAIYLYTMECVYRQLNTALRSEERQQLVPYFSYLKLLLTALSKLQDVNDVVWRGMRGNLTDQYPKGKRLTWWGFSSCTSSLEFLQKETFLGETGQRTLFNIQCFNGRKIEKHSKFPDESEVLLLPCSFFEVMGSITQGPDLRIIHLKQIQPPVVLLQLPPSPFATTSLSSESNSSVNSSWTKMNVSETTISAGALPMRSSCVDIHPNARWNEDGQTVGGQNPPLNGIRGVFVAEDQMIYVADYGNHRIVAWEEGEAQGQVVAGGNGEGEGDHQLRYPTDVIVDQKNDSLLICDRNNNRVVRWPRKNGTRGETILSNIRCFGLTMDEEGSLYVTDTNKDEVRRYGRGDWQGTVVAGGNGKGDRLEQLNSPLHVFVDREHSVFVSDVNNHRVMKWTEGAKEGMIVAGVRGQGDRLSQLHTPYGVVVDQLGTVYVVDTRNNRVVRWPKGAQQGTLVVGGYGQGAESNKLNWPEGLSFDRYGNLYVVDRKNNRLQKFTLETSLK